MCTAIAEGIFYCGANERTVKKFENIWPIPHGVSCNSYLVIGDKIALIDGIAAEMYESHLTSIKKTIGDKGIDYMIVNHVEPDHSASIARITKDYPNITIVGNNKTIEMLRGFYNIQCETLIVKDEDILDLGSHKLQFYLTPMLHWPETMMTYDISTETLFAGDAFGCFGSLNGHIIDRDLNLDLYYSEMKRYYASIVGKYGVPVQQALKKLGHLSFKTICSTHGPVWQDHIAETVAIYDQFSQYKADKGVVIAYASMYGNTTAMAEEMANKLAKEGITNIILHDLCVTDISYVLSDIFSYDTLILASSVYNSQLLPDMENLMAAIQSRGIKNRRLASFGTYAWGSAPLKAFEEFAEKMNWDLVSPVLAQKFTLNEEGDKNLSTLAQAIAATLK